MELKLYQRENAKKSGLNAARRSGLIPAVMYKQGQPGHSVAIEEAAFSAFLRKLKPGSLSTTQLQLQPEKGKGVKAIIKEIQYHPTTYRVLHLDLLELSGEAEITVKVPLECVGVADCVGVKQGGVLRQVLRYVRVRCLPKDMPAAFLIDVRELGINQAKRIRDLEVSKNVRVLDKPEEVALAIAKR